jgi:hypothetical protein
MDVDTDMDVDDDDYVFVNIYVDNNEHGHYSTALFNPYPFPKMHEPKMCDHLQLYKKKHCT